MGDWASPLSQIRWFPGPLALSPGSLGGPLASVSSHSFAIGLSWAQPGRVVLRPLVACLGLSGRHVQNEEGRASGTSQVVSSWLTFRGVTCGQSNLHVAQLAEYPQGIPTGQKATRGPGRIGLDLEPLEEPWQMAGEPPCPLCPCPSSELATPPLSHTPLSWPLLPHCLRPWEGQAARHKEGLK